jgi:hypothetical protein
LLLLHRVLDGLDLHCDGCLDVLRLASLLLECLLERLLGGHPDAAAESTTGTIAASASAASASAHCCLACCDERPQLQRPQLQRKGLLVLEMLTLLQLLSLTHGGTGGTFSSERSGAGV